MQTTKILKTAWLAAVLSIAGWTTAQAQTQYYANWTGSGGDGLWNNGANWDLLVVPGADASGTTNATISSGNTVRYNSVMTATGFGNLTNNGVMIVNTNGFNCSLINLPQPTAGPAFYLTNGFGVVTVSGAFALVTNGTATMVAGTSLTAGSLLVESTHSSHASGTSTFTNSGGTLNANITQVGAASGTGTGKLVISGGVNNLGNTFVGRYGTTSASTLGATEGLNIFGGVVTMSNLNTLAAASFGSIYITGGTVTNFGNVTINAITAASSRYMRLVQAGGLFVVPDPGIIYEDANTAGGETARYQVTGGTNIVGGFYLGDSNTIVAATATLTIGSAVYVGSQGIATNGGVLDTITLNNGGMFGATAPWTGSAAMTFSTGSSGQFTFQTADMTGNPQNITLTGALGGSGNLNKTGSGILLLNAANNYSGNTLVNGGTLALGSVGSLTSSTIIVGPGATFDVSGVASGFVLNNNQTLSGYGGSVAGAVNAAPGAIINPGSNTLSGTLTLSSSLTETNGGVINHFDLAGVPNPNNDFLVVNGDLNVGGTNTVDISGALLLSGTNYALIQYGGNFNGDITNFVVTTAIGTLSNDVVGKTIYFTPLATLRGATNTIWVGQPMNTNWDTEVSTSTNWLIPSSGKLDVFLPGDSVQFTDSGASNSPINIVGTVYPTSVLVNSHSNYVFASTSGGLIGGTASLTVSNTGTLTILTTNTYTGLTTIDGGSTLAVSQLAYSLQPSAIGKSGNLAINNGTFSYSGPGTNIDLNLALGAASAAVSISANGNLTLSGNLTGTGGLTKVGSGSLLLTTGSSSYAGMTTLSNGTLQVSTPTQLATNAVIFNGGTLTLASSSLQVFYANNFQVPSTGTMIFNGANSSLIIGTSGGTGSISGSGTLNIDIPNASGYCTVNANLENLTGTIHLTDDTLGQFRFNSGGNNNAPQECTGSTNATFDLGNGSVTLFNRNGGGSSGGTNYSIYDLGALAGGANTFVKGGTAASTYSIGAKNLSTTYSGSIQDGSGGSTSITVIGAGTLTLLGQNTYTGTTTISNSELALAYNPTNSSDGSIGGSAIINVLPGAFLDVSGRSDQTLQLGASSTQQLRGRGTINGSLNVGGNGTVAPGGGPGGSTGTLTVTNNIILGGTTWMKLNRTNSQTSDLLVSSHGAISYGGTLVVTNIGDKLQKNDTFTLFSPAGSGSFTLVLPKTYSWDTSQLNNNGSITVTGFVTPPTITKIDYSQLASGVITLYGTNSYGTGDYVSVNVLTTTNIALPLSSWTLYEAAYFDANGILVDPVNVTPGVTITVDPTQPQNFFMLQY